MRSRKNQLAHARDLVVRPLHLMHDATRSIGRARFVVVTARVIDCVMKEQRPADLARSHCVRAVLADPPQTELYVLKCVVATMWFGIRGRQLGQELLAQLVDLL